MNPWKWYRARRWWLQLILGLVLVPVALAILYVAGRSLQYASSEKDAAAYVPATANVVVRARDLEGHARRIRESTAWRVLQRKFLKDPVLRKELNDLLQKNDAPSLDDLEDERKPFARHQERVLHALGSDVIATLQVRDALPTAPFCAIVRLRWLHYLAAPFARLILPRETVGGESCLVVRQGTQEIRVAFVGSLAIASSDKALLEKALLRKGREAEGGRPVEARMVFAGSPGMMKIRKEIQDSGLFPYVKWPTARGVSLSADLRDATLVFDAVVDRAEPLRPSAPPLVIRSWAPVETSGILITNTGGQDLIAWLRTLIVPGSRDGLAQGLQDALQTLDDGGLTSKVLPLLQDGLAVLTGVEEQGGQVIPTITLVLPSSDPPAAVNALNALVKKIAGSWGDSNYFKTEPLGETTLYSWSWPDSLQIAALLKPSYAAVKGMVVIGSNQGFTTQLIRAAEQGDGLEQTSAFRKLRSRLKELGMSIDPSLAGGFLSPPQLREALTGSLVHVAKLTMPPVNGAALRAEVVAELTRGGRPPPAEEEIRRAYNEAIDRKIQEREADLRRLFLPMESIRWAAYDAQSGPQGITFKFALEFR